MMKKFIKLFIIMVFVFSLVQGFGCQQEESEGEKITKATGSIAISPTVCELTEGETKEFSVQTDIEGDIIWSISDMSVASLESNGNTATIYAINAGSTSLNVRVLNKVATAQVTVKAKEVQSNNVEFSTNIEAISLYVGQTVKAYGEIKADGIKQDVLFNFDSKDINVATVNSNGEIIPVNVGETEIIVSCNYNGKAYTKEILVEVRESIILAFSEPNIEIDALTGDELSTKDIECVVYKNGSVVNNSVVTWESLDESILQVDDTGKITVQKAGSTCVNAIYEEGGKEYTASCLVTVNHNKVYVETLNKIYVDLNETESSQIEVKLPTTMTGETVISAKNINGGEWQVNSNSLVLEKDKLVKGYNEYSFYTSVKEYIVSIYTADKVISSGDDFIDMLEEYTISEAKETKNKKVFVLSQDIKLNNTKRKNNQALYYGQESSKYGTNYFVDIFDGDGHKITSLDKKSTDANKRYIWTNGLFAVMMSATVKNLIVENALLSDNGSSKMGVIALQVQGESTIENCVIINPTVKNIGSNFSAGMIAGRIYNTNNQMLNIRNNLVIDMQENPTFSFYSAKDSNGQTVKQVYYTGENNCKYDGKIDGMTKNALCNFYGAIGDSALSAENTNIDDNYCLSKNGYLNASNPNKVVTEENEEGVWYEQERMPNGKVVTSLQDLIDSLSDRIKKYTLLKIENNSLYIRDEILSVRGDNFGNFHDDWIVG